MWDLIKYEFKNNKLFEISTDWWIFTPIIINTQDFKVYASVIMIAVLGATLNTFINIYCRELKENTLKLMAITPIGKKKVIISKLITAMIAGGVVGILFLLDNLISQRKNMEGSILVVLLSIAIAAVIIYIFLKNNKRYSSWFVAPIISITLGIILYGIGTLTNINNISILIAIIILIILNIVIYIKGFTNVIKMQELN